MNPRNLLIRFVMSAAAAGLLIYVRNEGVKELTATELALVGIAFVPWLSEFVSSFKIGADGVEVITQRLEKVEKKAGAAFDASVNGVAKNPRTTTRRRLGKPSEEIDADTVDDPNHGKFGGKDESEGRLISGRVEKIPDEDYYRRVVVRVESTDKRKPLTGRVTFYLHPTFKRECYDVKVKNGVAETTFVAYGAFTVGAKADSGKTLLELDLKSLTDGDAFFER